MYSKGAAVRLLVWLCSAVLCAGGCGANAWQRIETSVLGAGSGVVASEIGHGRPYIYVSINGHEPAKFLFDTGANINSISPRGAELFGLVGHSLIDSIDANDNRRANPLAVADRVEFGAVLQSGVPFLITERHRLADDDVLGTIGINGLQGFTVDLDLPENRVSITNERLDPRSPGVTGYISREFAKVYVPVKIGLADERSTVWALLDTGNNGGLRLTKHQSRVLTQIELARIADIAVSSHGVPWTVSDAPVVGSVLLGETSLVGIMASVNEAGNNIGMALYRDFHIKIDGVSKLVSFERPDRAPRAVWVEHLGLHPLLKGRDGWRPSFVIPGGLADSVGMSYQDEVVLIDGGVPSEVFHCSAYWPVTVGAEGVTLRVLREGEEVDVYLALDGVNQ